MPQNESVASARWNDFSLGWCPSDSVINGRQNSLSVMDNVCLDVNGDLTLIGGTDKTVGATYDSDAIRLFSSVVASASMLYAATSGGRLYRGGTQLATGGDSSRAAFASAFNYTLLASGNKRLKDDGTTAVNLGIATPPTAPVMGSVGYYRSSRVNKASNTDTNITGSVLHNANDGIWGVSGFANPSGDSINYVLKFLTVPTATQTQAVMLGYDSTGTLDAAAPSRLTGQFDIMYMPVLRSVDATLPLVDYSIPYAVTLVLGLSDTTSAPTDYFTTTQVVINGVSQGITQSGFIRVGSDPTLSWKDVKSAIITFAINVNSRFTTHSTVVMWLGAFTNPISVNTVDYAYQGVNQSTQFQGASQITTPLTVNAANATVINFASVVGANGWLTIGGFYYVTVPDLLDTLDSQINQIWLYRRGGNLAQFYRTNFASIVTGHGNYIIGDYLSDTDALTLDITYNSNQVSINSTGISEKICEIIGPIQGRWYYFTPTFMYPSSINMPDLVDVSLAVRTCGSTSEVFLWAQKVAEGVVLVGTSVDVYVLSGTFATLSDGTVDIYYRPIGCKFPPVTIDSTFNSGWVYYLSAEGWRMINAYGMSQSIVAPNIDILYKNTETAVAYGVQYFNKTAGTFRTPIVAVLDKLWCHVDTAQFHVYDLTRKYWFRVKYGLGACTALCSTTDGRAIGCFHTDLTSRAIGVNYDYGTSPVKSGLLIDGTTKQTVNIKSQYQDGQAPLNRKEFYTFKSRFDSSDSLTISVLSDAGTTTSLGAIVGSASVGAPVVTDISNVVPVLKSFQYILTGTVGSLFLHDLTVYYQLFPDQLTANTIQPNNFGVAAKKRVRVWPFVIDTLGNDVVFTPNVDGTNVASQTVNTTGKRTVLIYYVTDSFGIDYGMSITGTLFELWDALAPDVVQTLPIGRKFDQVGPEELFRYGKIKQLELRILPVGGTVIPITIYMNDNSTYTDSITVVDGVEATYYIGTPKGTAGNIVRIEIGPTTFEFHRFYVRLQVMKSGRDTELEWVTLGIPPMVGGQ